MTETNETKAVLERFKSLSIKDMAIALLTTMLVMGLHMTLGSGGSSESIPPPFIAVFTFSLAVGVQMGYDITKDVPGFLINVASSIIVGLIANAIWLQFV